MNGPYSLSFNIELLEAGTWSLFNFKINDDNLQKYSFTFADPFMFVCFCAFCKSKNISDVGHSSSMAFLFDIRYEITVLLRGQPVRDSASALLTF